MYYQGLDAVGDAQLARLIHTMVRAYYLAKMIGDIRRIQGTHRRLSILRTEQIVRERYV